MEQRYIFTFLAFVGNMVNMFGRDSLRIGVLAILKENQECRAVKTSSCGDVVWEEGSVAQVLSGFNYGMILTLLLGGPLADMFGGKLMLLSTTLVSSLCTSLLPVLATRSLPGLVISQMVYGMSGGLVVPALSSMLASWEPLNQRGRLSTLVYSGSTASAALTSVFTGLMCHQDSDHWRMVFLLLGTMPLLWIPAWTYLVSNTPRQHPRISKSEQKLLSCTTSTSECRPSLRDIPLRAILTSRPVWGAVLGNMGVSWAFAHTSSLLPQYLASHMGMQLHLNGIASAVPHLGCFLTGLLASLLYSWLTRSRGLHPTTARKLCSSICLWGFALLCLPLLFVHDALLITVLSSASYSMMGLNLVGAWGSPQDMAPNYVATVMGLVGLGCYLVNALVPHTLTLATVLLAPHQVSVRLVE